MKPVSAKYTDKLAAAKETELMLAVFRQPGPLGISLQFGELLPPADSVIVKLSNLLPGPMVMAPKDVITLITAVAQSGPEQTTLPVPMVPPARPTDLKPVPMSVIVT